MNILLNINDLLNWQTLLVLLSGIFLGFIIFGLIYLYAVVRSLSSKVRTKKVEEEDVDEQEIRWLIKDAQKTFNDKKIRDEEGYATLLSQLTKDLSNDIASKFYPSSKYPYLELTIDETILLIGYISKRFDELMSKRILKLFRGLTINQLIIAKDTKDSFDNHRIVKGIKKRGVAEVVKGFLTAINIVNPVHWIRKSIGKVSDLIFVKIGLAIIGIAGEETYKIYSKKVFDEEKTIDTGIDDLYRDLAEEMEKEYENESEKEK